MKIFNHFQHLTLSQDQELALTKLESFLNGTSQVFMLKGYAGSGKTTIIKGLIEYLESTESKYMIMAPTGRAAKVIRDVTGAPAYTVHKSIYCYDDLQEINENDSFCYQFKIRDNNDIVGTVFIIDEASMLSDMKSSGEFFRFGTDHLLTDLITYSRVKSIMAQTKIIFVGDPCQLPPVGDSNSRAFDEEYLVSKFNVAVEQAEIKEVKRQGGESGVLKVASRIRKSISAHFFNDFNLNSNGEDVFNPQYNEFLDTWKKAIGTKIIIAYKNKTCLDLNKQIRELRYGQKNLPIQSGDIVILGTNNYHKGVFNGEFAVVNYAAASIEERIILLKDKAPISLKWRRVTLLFPDSENNHKMVTGTILENFLYGGNNLTPDEMQALYVDFCKRHAVLKPGTKAFKDAIINDDYFNGLHVKFGYAVTCHKAQGGEWDNVFTVWDHNLDDKFDCFQDKQEEFPNESFFRWAYTAVSRASKYLFALNPPFFNSYSNMSFVDLPVSNSLQELAGGNSVSEEIEFDAHCFSGIKGDDAPMQLQHHFIKLHYLLKKHGVEISGWEKKNMEIFYSLKSNDQKAVVKTWVNKDLVFNGKIQSVPSLTNSKDLVDLVEQAFRNIPSLTILSNEKDLSNLDNNEFEFSDDLPFTIALFDDIQHLLKNKNIVVREIEHFPFRERYAFVRGIEKAVLDFEYNKAGFFGRVLAIQNKSRGSKLVIDIMSLLNELKENDNAK